MSMSMSFTPEQEEAIAARGGCVLVSAGAGSGKTRVLTERVMRRLREGEDIDRFLIITFTRAAAGELRARIAGAITEALRENPRQKHLRRQLILCRSAHIGTIHSFCGDLLREQASAAGISPAFRILDEEKSERILEGALERVLDRAYEKGEKEFLTLVDSLGAGRDDRRLSSSLLSLYKSMQSHERPMRWAEEQIRLSEKEPASLRELPWGETWMADNENHLRFYEEQMREAMRDMETDLKLMKGYYPSFESSCEAMKSAREALKRSWDEASACFPIPFPRITARNPEDPALAEHVKTVRKSCKDAMEKMAVSFQESEETLLARERVSMSRVRTLLRLAMELDEEVRRTKRRANCLDFADLEHISLSILTEEDGSQNELGRQISARFTEIMVDEYQDVSRVQDSLFHAVSREGSNLFLVGDLKQSIYRFRLADPAIFTEKASLYGSEENCRGDRLIHLNANFRSTSAILGAVNDVFSRCMSAELGNLDYGRDEMLRSGRVGEAGDKPQLILLEKDDSEEDFVAEEILRLMKESREKEGEKPLNFGDFAILLRAAKKDGDKYRQAMLRRGIPSTAVGGGDFFAAEEVDLILNMLSVIDNPHRDIPLLSVLRSAAVGFGEESLGRIRAASPGTDYYTALCRDEDERSHRFLRILERLRAEAPDLDPVDLTDRIIEALDLNALCAAMPDGSSRCRRLVEMSLLGEDFLATGERGLHRYLRWLKTRREKGEMPSGGEGGADAVQILSIHKSKGLEFPVVILAELGKQFNFQDSSASVLVHPRLGLGLKMTDVERYVEYPTAARQAIAAEIKKETLSEQLRLVYVAMTRARDRLVMTAVVPKTEEKLEKFSEWKDNAKIPAPVLRNCSSAVYWLLPAALAGKTIELRVETEEEETGADSGDETVTNTNVESGAMAETNGAKDDKAGQGSEKSVWPSADEELVKLLNRNLRFRYPWKAAESLPSKLTATELKRMEQEQDPDGSPLLRQKMQRFEPLPEKLSSLTPTARGTAVHRVMQKIRLDHVSTEEEIRDEIARLTEEGFLSVQEAEAVDPGMILRFYSGELGRRILGSSDVRREFRFSLLTPACRLIPGETSEDEILLQGSADLVFREGDTLVLVDYKTDRIPDEKALEERVEHYRIQLDTYAGALERIFDLPVKEKNLYFLSLEKQVMV